MGHTSLLRSEGSVLSADLSRLSILIIDDNRYMCNIVRQMLNSFGIRDVRANIDAIGALEELTGRPADIAIVDYLMEPLTGLEFTEMVRTASDSSNPFMPIIIMTAYTERKRVEAARDCGANSVLMKPMSPTDLYNRILSVIRDERPYVKIPNYFGPDRRRGIEDPITHDDRRSISSEI